MTAPEQPEDAISKHEPLVNDVARRTAHLDNKEAYREITRVLREATGYKQNMLRWLRDRAWHARRQLQLDPSDPNAPAP